MGTVAGQHGLFQSIDGGQTWRRINDDAHQWGLVLHVSGDPRPLAAFTWAPTARHRLWRPCHPSRQGQVMRILFFCMGNICRSPTAEAVMRAKLQIGVAAEIQARRGELRGQPRRRRGVGLAPTTSRQRRVALQSKGSGRGRSSVAPLVRGTPDARRALPRPFRVHRGPISAEQTLDHIEVDPPAPTATTWVTRPTNAARPTPPARPTSAPCAPASSPAADFEHFDLVLGMDDGNLREARRICPPEHRERLKLLMDFAPRPAHPSCRTRTTTAPPRLNRCWTSSKRRAMGWCAACSAPGAEALTQAQGAVPRAAGF